MRTFLDSGVLIAGWRGATPQQVRALTILNDPRRKFLSSPLVELEVMPKAVWHQQLNEVEFYRSFFDAVEWSDNFTEIVARAKQVAAQYGLGAMDALHITAAILANADEFITTERKTSPVMKVKEIKVVTIL